jgi:hypothetical protein
MRRGAWVPGTSLPSGLYKRHVHGAASHAPSLPALEHGTLAVEFELASPPVVPPDEGVMHLVEHGFTRVPLPVAKPGASPWYTGGFGTSAGVAIAAGGRGQRHPEAPAQAQAHP